MKVKNIIDEDFINYKKPVMFILTTKCSMKCNINGNIVCQNYDMLKLPDIEISEDALCKRYLSNPITSAIVFGGLEPFDTGQEVLSFIECLRNKYHCNDTVVIYTGYYEEEVLDYIEALKSYNNIIVKFGRYIPGHEPHIDSVLGVQLISDNQYAKKIC